MGISIFSLSFIFFSSPFHAGHVRGVLLLAPGPRGAAMILCLPFPLLILLSQFLSFIKAQKEGAAAHQSGDISPSPCSLFAALIRYSSFIMPPTPRGSLGTGAVWSGYRECSSESNEFESSELAMKL